MLLLLRQAAGTGSQEAAARYGLSAQDRAFLEGARAGQGILRTPKGVARVEVLPSPWLLELMGGPPAGARGAAAATEAEAEALTRALA